MKQQTRQQLIEDMQNARYRMHRESPGSDKWWVAYYDLRKAESLLGQRHRSSDPLRKINQQT